MVRWPGHAPRPPSFCLGRKACVSALLSDGGLAVYRCSLEILGFCWYLLSFRVRWSSASRYSTSVSCCCALDPKTGPGRVIPSGTSYTSNAQGVFFPPAQRTTARKDGEPSPRGWVPLTSFPAAIAGKNSASSFGLLSPRKQEQVHQVKFVCRTLESAESEKCWGNCRAMVLVGVVIARLTALPLVEKHTATRGGVPRLGAMALGSSPPTHSPKSPCPKRRTRGVIASMAPDGHA